MTACVYVRPEDHRPRTCRACRTLPYCDQCWGHHRPLDDVIPKVDGPVATRAVALKADGSIACVLAEFGPGGAGAGEAALAYARGNPGRRAAAEKLGVWFDPWRWQRFLTVGPFTPSGKPAPASHAGEEFRDAYLAEQARLAALRAAQAPPGRKGRSRRW